MTNNFLEKFNNYFILIAFLISTVSMQFGFLNSLKLFYFSSIDLFLIIILLICVSTKKFKKILFPVLLITLLSGIYSSKNIEALFISYSITALIIFYLNKGPLFIIDRIRLSLLTIITVVSFRIMFLLLNCGIDSIINKHFVFTIEHDFIFSLLFQCIYSILILFLFKPDIKYINYEFLVGD